MEVNLATFLQGREAPENRAEAQVATRPYLGPDPKGQMRTRE